jgi:hypothetical protein
MLWFSGKRDFVFFFCTWVRFFFTCLLFCGALYIAEYSMSLKINFSVHKLPDYKNKNKK